MQRISFSTSSIDCVILTAPHRPALPHLCFTPIRLHPLKAFCSSDQATIETTQDTDHLFDRPWLIDHPAWIIFSNHRKSLESSSSMFFSLLKKTTCFSKFSLETLNLAPSPDDSKYMHSRCWKNGSHYSCYTAMLAVSSKRGYKLKILSCVSGQHSIREFCE